VGGGDCPDGAVFGFLLDLLYKGAAGAEIQFAGVGLGKTQEKLDEWEEGSKRGFSVTHFPRGKGGMY